MGYIGPCVVKQLRNVYPNAALFGFDMGYFATFLSNSEILPECKTDIQYFSDVRKIKRAILEGVDATVHLAAISNDPMGKTFEAVTMDINYRASVELAKIML
jgi:nucleoside-diphosphate-sugar epimerase